MKIRFMKTSPTTKSTPAKTTPSAPAPLKIATPPTPSAEIHPSALAQDPSLSYLFGLLSASECQAYEAEQERSSNAREANQRAKSLRDRIDQWSDVSVPSGLVEKTLQRISQAAATSIQASGTSRS